MSGTVSAASVILRGRRILVVEDEYMIAQEIAEWLGTTGAETLGPVARVNDAMQIISSEDWIDGALLDVTIDNEPIWSVVDALRSRGVPIVLATGYDASVIPSAYARLPLCQKPSVGTQLMHMLARALTDAATS